MLSLESQLVCMCVCVFMCDVVFGNGDGGGEEVGRNQTLVAMQRAILLLHMKSM